MEVFGPLLKKDTSLETLEDFGEPSSLVSFIKPGKIDLSRSYPLFEPA
jgi:hypothetical protein